MALLGLDLDGLLGKVTGTVDDLLGNGLGDLVGNLAPGSLIDDLGGTLDDLLGGVGGGDPTGLLQGLLDNNLLDLASLQDVLGGVTGGAGGLDLGSLDDLLSNVDTSALQGILDDVFDPSGLLGGGTVIDELALGDLGPLDLSSTTTFVTGVVGTVLDVAGDTADIGLILDSLLSGDDDLKGDASGNHIEGRAGADSIQGMAGNDTLSGGDANDTVRGGDGDDRLTGDAGNDQLFGDAGQDVLNGGVGGDLMRGGLGDDIYYIDNSADRVIESSGQGKDTDYTTITHALEANVENIAMLGTADLNAAGNSLNNVMTGNIGTNRLGGGDGNDVLLGRGGNDVLIGGHGNDVFRYSTQSDSTLDKGNRDIVMDFGDGHDRLDFSYVDADTHESGDQAFKFIGTSHFSANGEAQIRFAEGTTYTIVSADINGDGSLDMAVKLQGLHHLTAADFIL